MMKRIYKMGGIRLVQRPLTFGQWEKVREALKGKALGYPALTPDGVGEWVDRAMDARVLLKLATIVLTPYEPTPIHRWLNARALARHRGKSLEDIIGDAQEFPTAIADFFVLNVKWWEMWLSTPLRLGYLTKGPTPGQGLASLARVYFTLAAGTSLTQNGGAPSPPQPS